MTKPLIGTKSPKRLVDWHFTALDSGSLTTSRSGRCSVPDWETSIVGPFDRWSDGLGFDYFYGFVGGDTDQFTPALVENKKRIEPPMTNEDGSPYHLTTDLADHAIRMMEVFAAFTVHTDHEVGRLVDAIKEMGRLANTLIIYMACDNGSSAEGDLNGLLNETTFFNGIPEPLEKKLAAIDTLGSDKHFHHFPAG